MDLFYVRKRRDWTLSVLILDMVIKLQPIVVWGIFGVVWQQKGKFCSGWRLQSPQPWWLWLCSAVCSQWLPEDGRSWWKSHCCSRRLSDAFDRVAQGSPALPERQQAQGSSTAVFIAYLGTQMFPNLCFNPELQNVSFSCDLRKLIYIFNYSSVCFNF